MEVWVALSNDKYRLPVAVADSAVELARMVGVTAETIRSSVYHARVNNRNSRFVKVDIGDLNEQT